MNFRCHLHGVIEQPAIQRKEGGTIRACPHCGYEVATVIEVTPKQESCQ